VPPKYVAPDISLKAFSCPVCGALADQTWTKLAPKEISDGDRTPQLITAEILKRFHDETPLDLDSLEERKPLLDYGKKVLSKQIFLDNVPRYGSELEFVNLYVSKCRSCEQCPSGIMMPSCIQRAVIILSQMLI
jgi:hypothetical protein